MQNNPALRGSVLQSAILTLQSSPENSFAPAGAWWACLAQPTARAVGYFLALLRSFMGRVVEPAALRNNREIRPNQTGSNQFYEPTGQVVGEAVAPSSRPSPPEWASRPRSSKVRAKHNFALPDYAGRPAWRGKPCSHSALRTPNSAFIWAVRKSQITKRTQFVLRLLLLYMADYVILKSKNGAISIWVRLASSWGFLSAKANGAFPFSGDDAVHRPGHLFCHLGGGLRHLLAV
jgi:hypothetical protein